MKMFSKLKSLFSCERTETQKKFDKAAEEHNEMINPEPKSMLEPAPATEPKSVEFNIDTGKIVYPDNLTAEEKAQLDVALKELTESLQKFAPEELYKSLEQFLAEGGKSGGGIVIPFTKANDLPDALLQVAEEMGNSKDDTDHWSDEDFIEALFGYYNQGYVFTGIEDMAVKVNERLELSQHEKKQLRDWYVLATQEIVFDV